MMSDGKRGLDCRAKRGGIMSLYMVRVASAEPSRASLKGHNNM
jgi:hypothetical protein